MAYLIGHNAKIQLKISSTFTDIPQVAKLTPPPYKMDKVETTHLQSTAKEYKATIIDPQEASFMLEYDPSNTVHAQLFSNFQAGALSEWKIIITDNGGTPVLTTFDFFGFVSDFGISELSVEAVVQIPVKVQISGLPTVTVV